MVDNVPSRTRSWIMRRVRGKDTAPELLLRSLLHRLGYRFRLHRQNLPGRPDIVFPSRGKVIFIHGCFWHGHSCRRGARIPKSNRRYWNTKIAGNRARDSLNRNRLRHRGWRAMIIWECQLSDLDRVTVRAIRFLDTG
ncbi:MAG: DNA mismatch endonuclease Vsr [candidate division Zixibacteria bacterium]|nr:DNA mismatch endonuclease Vsr [candidate division Zixibacteria bacterium]